VIPVWLMENIFVTAATPEGGESLLNGESEAGSRAGISGFADPLTNIHVCDASCRTGPFVAFDCEGHGQQKFDFRASLEPYTLYDTTACPSRTCCISPVGYVANLR